MPEPGATFTLRFKDAASGQYIRATKDMLRTTSLAAAKIKSEGKGVAVTIDRQAQAMQRAKKRAFGYSQESRKMRGVTSGLRREIGALRNQLLLVAFAYQTLRRVIIPMITLAAKQEDVERRLHFLMVEKAKLSEEDYQISLARYNLLVSSQKMR